MFEKLFVKTSDLVFHTIAPYSVERERFLEHCCEEVFSKAALRRIAGIVRALALKRFADSVQAPGAPISVEEQTSMAPRPRLQRQNPPLQTSSAIPA